MYRIIIADDEALECKVLEKIIFQKCPEAKVLPSVSNGLELISRIEQEIPEIAIVDINMPGLNGLDTIEIIRSKHPEIKFLIVSAYSKFEYAQKALSLGASDYLLKPIKEKDFLSALQKIFHTIAAEKQQKGESQELELILENYRTAIENEFISSLIYDEIHKETMQKYLDTLPQPFYSACMVSVRFLHNADSDTDPAYQNFLCHLKTICTCLGKEQKNNLILCLFFFSAESQENYREQITENLECVLKKQSEFKQYAIGVSSLKFTIQELSNGIQESQFALFERTSPGIYFWELKTNPVYTSEREDCLLLIKQGQYQALTKSLRKIIQKAEKQDEPFLYIQIYVLDLMHTAFQKIPHIKSGYSLQEFITWIYWDKILHQQNYTELYHTTNWLLDQYMNEDADTKFPANHYILNSLSYISEHYMEDLALETIAEQNNISSFYLSRLFKQELGHTFLELLTDIRISRALDLLYCETCSVQEISELCGYVNTSYFYKLFKKQTGMTIKKMRSLLYLVHPEQAGQSVLSSVTVQTS